MLPGNSLESLIDGARKIVVNPTGECAKLLGKNALDKFNKIASNMRDDPDRMVLVEGMPGEPPTSVRLGDQGPVGAVTVGQNVYFNPNAWSRTKSYQAPIIVNYFAKLGVSQYQYGVAEVIHEFLHAIGKFGKDLKIGPDGKLDVTKSAEYQKRVIDACVKKGSP